MGKVFCNNKSALKIAILLSIIFLATLDTYASYKESELFKQGYECYLSYQPEKAVEVFRIFIKEFPDSSAKDAVMFWLGKSLIQLHSFEEAKKVFSEIKQQFPESPFVAYIDREIEEISKAESKVNKMKAELSEAIKAKDALEERLAEIEKKAKLTEKDLSNAIEDRDKLRLFLEEEKTITEELKMRVSQLEEKDTELKTLQSKFEEQQKNQEERDEYLKLLKDERDQLDSQTHNLKNELSKAIEDGETLRVLLEEEKKKTEWFQVRIRELEGKETVLKILLSQVEEKQKGWKNEKDQFNSYIQQLEKDKAQIENEREKLKGMVKEYEDVLAMMEEKAEADISAALNAKNTLEARIAEIEKMGEITDKDVSTTEHPSEPETKQEPKLMYSVHIALFGKITDAEALSKEYVKKGYDAYVQKAVSKDRKKTSYRVLIGKFENKKEAFLMAKIIRDKEKISVFIFSE